MNECDEFYVVIFSKPAALLWRREIRRILGWTPGASVSWNNIFAPVLGFNLRTTYNV
jgi:hypothetical protein